MFLVAAAGSVAGEGVTGVTGAMTVAALLTALKMTVCWLLWESMYEEFGSKTQ